MKIALYQGTSLTSRAIKFVTRSNYSHAALLFDAQAAAVAADMNVMLRFGKLKLFLDGAVVEAWEPGGVRNTPNLRCGHEPGTRVDVFALRDPLDDREERRMLVFLDQEMGWPYDWTSVIRFVTKRPGNLDKAWFCSELAMAAFDAAGRELLARTQPWEVPPDWLSRTPALRLEQSVVI